MKAGDIIPNFILKDQNGIDFELYKNLEKKILLVFYPKDNTPVCSAQLAEYNHSWEKFKNSGINLVGISSDSVRSHYEFCTNLKLSFPLLADDEKKIIRKFKAINFLGMNKRLLVMVGSDRKVLWVASRFSLFYLKAAEILEKVKAPDMKEMT